MQELEDKIRTHLLTKYPEEGCGIILNKQGKLEWLPCENVAENKEESFALDSSVYIKAHLLGDIYAIVHSHVNSSPDLSEADISASNFLGIKYIVYSIPEGEKREYTPKKAVQKLTGRTYEFGKNDCYTLVKDYYKQEKNITLPTMDFKDFWWENGLDYFNQYYKDFGFIEVTSPKPGDGIIFAVRSNVPNHCGIYLKEDLLLHHAENRLSCRESLYPFWIKNIVRYVRYANS